MVHQLACLTRSSVHFTEPAGISPSQSPLYWNRSLQSLFKGCKCSSIIRPWRQQTTLRSALPPIVAHRAHKLPSSTLLQASRHVINPYVFGEAFGSAMNVAGTHRLGSCCSGTVLPSWYIVVLALYDYWHPGAGIAHFMCLVV